MNSWTNYLSLAQKANKVASGSKVLETIRANKAYLVLVASDASDNTKKQLFNKSKYYGVECLSICDSQKLSIAIGKASRMYLAITDENLARMIKSKIEEE